jgi:hypothetical protein
MIIPLSTNDLTKDLTLATMMESKTYMRRPGHGGPVTRSKTTRQRTLTHDGLPAVAADHRSVGGVRWNARYAKAVGRVPRGVEYPNSDDPQSGTTRLGQALVSYIYT